jgi:uncharacterized membrane protein
MTLKDFLKKHKKKFIYTNIILSALIFVVGLVGTSFMLYVANDNLTILIFAMLFLLMSGISLTQGIVHSNAKELYEIKTMLEEKLK